MRWNRRYVIKSYIRASLWLVPFFSVLAYMVVHRITFAIGGWLLRTGRIDETTAFLGLAMEGARSGLETIVTLKPFFPGIHIRFAARRDSSRRGAVHATDHRDDAFAG